MKFYFRYFYPGNTKIQKLIFYRKGVEDAKKDENPNSSSLFDSNHPLTQPVTL